jgi:hypothetical protein
MHRVENQHEIPVDAMIGNSFGRIDYFDVYSVPVNNTKRLSIDQVFSRFANFTPVWVKILFNIRNSIVRIIGLKTGDPESVKDEKEYKTGSEFSIFQICSRNNQEIVFGGDDKHLNFQSSLLLKRSGEADQIVSVTIVQIHNFTGHAYFFFVKPFHKLIVRGALKHLATVVESP